MKTIELKVTDEIFETIKNINYPLVYGEKQSVINGIRDSFFAYGVFRQLEVVFNNNTNDIVRNVDLFQQGTFIGADYNYDEFFHKANMGNKIVFNHLAVFCFSKQKWGNISFSINDLKHNVESNQEMEFTQIPIGDEAFWSCKHFIDFRKHIILDKDTRIIIDEIPVNSRVLFSFSFADKVDDFQIKIEE